MEPGTKLHAIQIKVLLAITKEFYTRHGIYIQDKRFVHLTYRTIQKQTNVSATYLPELIKRLENLGLIQTKIKKSNRTYKYFRINGEEIY